ncbi:hypothetical protein IFO69_13430 [Echinicola sp. CAU 1574]|uniref:Uncharacterized protein n=1 Tax=Echinicola arenosa TaxID=2774144 RepID=A0ABR9APF9_9BACT|nr:hypothetical protein [Echinicola arenosa]MBD8489753.1 hypothetical protein [Echinicola arenosa]
MRTSLDEIKQLEAYVFKQQSPEESLLMQAQLHLDKGLAERLEDQKKVYGLVQQYGRKRLKEEISQVEAQLFGEAKHRSFKERIFKIFNL